MRLEDSIDGDRRFLHVIQSSLRPKKHARQRPPAVPNVYEIYRRAFETGQREDDLVLYALAKKKVARCHKRVKLTPLQAGGAHLPGQGEGEGGASRRPTQHADLTHLAAAAGVLSENAGGEREMHEEEEQLDQEDVFFQGEAAWILKSMQRHASIPVQASIDAAVARAELRVECWAALNVDDPAALMAALDRACEIMQLEPSRLVLQLGEWLWRPSRGTGPDGKPRGLIAVAAGNKQGVPKAGAVQCLARVLHRFPPDLSERCLHELRWALQRAQELHRVQAAVLLRHLSLAFFLSLSLSRSLSLSLSVCVCVCVCVCVYIHIHMHTHTHTHTHRRVLAGDHIDHVILAETVTSSALDHAPFSDCMASGSSSHGVR